MNPSIIICRTVADFKWPIQWVDELMMKTPNCASSLPHVATHTKNIKLDIKKIFNCKRENVRDRERKWIPIKMNPVALNL